MSSSLLRSKQYRTRKNLKKLTISAPLSSPSLVNFSLSTINTSISVPISTTTNLRHDICSLPVIVLTAKYRFIAENPNELCIEPRDYLKLLERPGNGWLKVQMLDKYDQVGLIPASYVSIAVNDIINPISIEWIREYRKDAITDLDTNQSDGETDFDLPNKFSNGDADDDEDEDLFDFEKHYPLEVEFKQVLFNSNKKFWYKIKFTYSNKIFDKVYVAKFYQDFYELHVSLLAAFPDVPLPRFPQPLMTSLLPNSNGKIDKNLVEQLNAQSEALNRYTMELISIKKVQKSAELSSFINSCVQIRVPEDESTLMEEANEKLHPDSVDINTFDTHSYFSPTEPLPPISCLTTNLAFVILPTQLAFETLSKRSQRQASYYRVPKSTSSNSSASYSSLIAGYEEEMKPTDSISLAESKLNHNSTTSTNSSDNSSIFSRQFLDLPRTPMMDRTSEEIIFPLTPISPKIEDVTIKKYHIKPIPIQEKDYIKIKIALDNGDDEMIALKIRRSNLISIVYLKKIISFKIYKDYNLIDHYQLQIRNEEVRINTDELLLDYIKSNNKVNLKLVRSRGNSAAY